MSLTVRLLGSRRVPELQRPETAEQWKEIARRWYKVKYTYYEKEEVEETYIDEQWRLLSETVPDELREGIFLLELGGGFMGENVYIVDGIVTHNTHVPCSVCQTYNHVWRGGKIWCITCNNWEPT